MLLAIAPPKRALHHVRRRASWAMIGAGLLMLVWSGGAVVTNVLNQAREAQMWDQRYAAVAIPRNPNFHFFHAALAPGQQVAKMEVPSIHYTAVVLEGTADDILSNGPGHYIGTAFPGEPDNMVVSGHNGFWLSFPGLEKGDRVVFSDSDGRFTYVVDGKRVVNPDDQAAIGPTGRSTLSLTTCWPIWAGPFATQRLVITGHLITGS
ncbi:MAG: class D sortase [Candidatus Dormibacteria bacterium]